MRRLRILFGIASLLILAGCAHVGQIIKPEEKKSLQLRFIAWNVEYGSKATAEEIGEFLKEYKPDIVLFNEVPAGNWTQRAGQVLGMEYFYVGKISSANHPDKYKSILSRTPLSGEQEFELVLGGGGWPAASIVRAVADIDGFKIAVYSLHIRAEQENMERSHSHEIVARVLPMETAPRIVMGGDFNGRMDGKGMGLFLDAGFKDIWSNLGMEGQIDHIIFNRPKITRAVTGGTIQWKEQPLSDHNPVWADIEFRRE